MMWATGWCALTALGWFGAWLQSRRQVRSTPYRLRPVADARVAGGGLVVVVPARNEERNIARCVHGVLAPGDPGVRMVVLDDGSSDGTLAILQELSEQYDRLTVVGGADAPLPEGWLGKPWACQRAGEAALRHVPEWLLFLDADVELQPGGAAAAVQWMVQHELDLLSVMGTLELGSFWERVVQPAVVGLILAGNDVDRINDPSRRPARPLANGQFLLFRARSWEAMGGHQRVHSAIIDDVGLATALVRDGGQYHLLFGPAAFRCRMYTGLSEIWAGWTKNLYEGMGASPLLLAGLVGFVAGSVLLPWMLFPLAVMQADGLLAATALSAMVAMVLARVQLDRRFNQDPRYAWSIPLGWTMLVAMAVASAVMYHRGGIRWKGRLLPVSGRG